MKYCAGLDVSLEETSVCVVERAGKVVRETKVLSDPEAISQAMRVGLYRDVHVKSEASRALGVPLRDRWTLPRKRRDLDNQVRGTLKGFGLKVGKLGAKRFAHRVREPVADNADVAAMTEPMLRARTVLLEQAAVPDRLVVRAARDDDVCRLPMTAPGIGPVVALAWRTGVDAPGRFAKSRNVGAHFGPTPRAYASGEAGRGGRIGKCGDAMVRGPPFEAAPSLLTGAKTWSALKSWGTRIAKRRGPRRARVAVARRRAVMTRPIPTPSCGGPIEPAPLAGRKGAGREQKHRASAGNTSRPETENGLEIA